MRNFVRLLLCLFALYCAVCLSCWLLQRRAVRVAITPQPKSGAAVSKPPAIASQSTANPDSSTDAIEPPKPELPLPVREWKLAYVKDGSIWIANGDGAGQRKIIEDAESPCWSPGHRRIAFARRGDIWVANADGTGQRQLTHRWNWSKEQQEEARLFSGGKDIDIAWDPTANLITFSHWEKFTLTREGQKEGETIKTCSLFSVPVDHPTDEEIETVYDIFDNGADFYPSINDHPAWSADGQVLAFVREGDIWIAERSGFRGDGSGDEIRAKRRMSSWDWEVTRLAATAEYDAPTHRASRQTCFVTHLSWSRDGKSLVFGRQRMNGSGTAEIRLLRTKGDRWTFDTAHEICLEDGFDPCFSPDGKYIVYEGGWEVSPRGIMIQSVDGNTYRNLIEGGEQPVW